MTHRSIAFGLVNTRNIYLLSICRLILKLWLPLIQQTHLWNNTDTQLITEASTQAIIVFGHCRNDHESEQIRHEEEVGAHQTPEIDHTTARRIADLHRHLRIFGKSVGEACANTTLFVSICLFHTSLRIRISRHSESSVGISMLDKLSSTCQKWPKIPHFRHNAMHRLTTRGPPNYFCHGVLQCTHAAPRMHNIHNKHNIQRTKKRRQHTHI